MTQKRILTGDRATARLHIGHYSGSLENRVKLQHDYDQFIIIADVQALTTHYEHPERLKEYTYELCIDYLSTGIDPEKSTIFVQSMIPQIAELTAFYSMFVPVNTLRHNPTIKSEAAQYGYNDLMYGFLGYPVSQAADITFCGADLVPVGADQLPVIEVTRKIVRRFNDLYQPVLKEPETLLSDCPRLIGTDGNAKMSKSLGNAIFLSDDEATVTEKIKRAVTDPSRIHLKDPGHPEVCVVNAYHKTFNPVEHDNISEMCRSASIGCTACKKALSVMLNATLDPFREKRRSLEERPDEIKAILSAGCDRARREGQKTLEAVKDAMSLVRF